MQNDTIYANEQGMQTEWRIKLMQKDIWQNLKFLYDLKKTNRSYWSVAVHAFNPTTQKVEAGLAESKASLIYKVNSKTAGATQRTSDLGGGVWGGLGD